MTDIILSTQNGEPVASSRQIAENFGKAHRHVLDAIESILEGMPKIGQTPMFYKTEYTHEQNGQTYPMYLMNRDGFSLLVMGFTGKAALEWKLKYIQAFNEMEKKLAQRPQLSRSELMAQALIAAHDELEHKDRQIAARPRRAITAARPRRAIPAARSRRAITAARFLLDTKQKQRPLEKTALPLQTAYTVKQWARWAAILC